MILKLLNFSSSMGINNYFHISNKTIVLKFVSELTVHEAKEL